jgi:hypothetical protein
MMSMTMKNVLPMVRSALSALIWVLASGCGAPADDAPVENVGATSQAVVNCNGFGSSLLGQLCAVGESNGRPAVHYRGQWFSLDYNGGDWVLTNAVGANPIGVAPADWSQSTPGCNPDIQCPQNCSPWCDNARAQCYYHCGQQSPIVTEARRTYTFTIGGQSYTVEGWEKAEDRRVTRAGEQVRISHQTGIKITTTDPVDGNPWTLSVHAMRAKSGAADQNQVNEQVTAPDAVNEVGATTTLFPSSQVNAYTTAAVELMAAVKTGSSGAGAMTANSNLAMNRAIDSALGAGSSFQQHYEPEALQAVGNVLSRVPGASFASGSYDLQRFSQFYLDTRRGQSGFSSQGSGERPLVQTQPREWRFYQTVRDYEVYYPFLAGICGLEAGIHSYVSGSYAAGRNTCFDGLAMSVGQRGNLEFSLKANGGFGCNIFVASASAGLSAGVKAAAEFSTELHTDTIPPSVSASVNVYSEVNFNAYFKTRVLFWSRKWEKTLGTHRLFQKSASFSLPARQTEPALQLCGDGGPTLGSCDDPQASCDITGRCVRYEGGEVPTLVDVGPCFLAGQQRSICGYPPVNQNNAKRVTTVYMVPIDKSYIPEYEENVARALQHVQLYFANQFSGRMHGGRCYPVCAGHTGADPDGDGFGWENNASCVVEGSAPYHEGTSCGGSQPRGPGGSSKTFTMDPVRVQARPRDSNWYRTDRTSGGSDEERWVNNVRADAEAFGARHNDPDRIWLLFIDADPGCGQRGGSGSQGLAMLTANDLRGLSGRIPVPNCPNQTENSNPCRWVGGLAHEIGHALGLRHPPNCDPTQPGCRFDALMHTGYLSYPAAVLLDEDSRRLDASPFFSRIPTPPSACLCSDVIAVKDKIFLRADNGQYVAAEPNGVVNANRPNPGPWETFTVAGGTLHHGATVFIRNHWNKFFMAVNGGGGELRDDSTNMLAWETFTLVRQAGPGAIQSGDKVSLRTISGHYLAADGGGGGIVHARHGHVGTWETFTLEIRP